MGTELKVMPFMNLRSRSERPTHLKKSSLTYLYLATPGKDYERNEPIPTLNLF